MDHPTRQQLIELVYDLLPEAEAAELRQRIAADAQVAQAYAEVLGTVELFGEAARLPAEKIPLRRPERISSVPAAVKGNGSGRAPWARAANWTVVTAASLLLAISLGGYWYHREQLAGIAAEHLRLVVTGPTTIERGAAAVYHVTTTAVTGTAMPAQVEFALSAPDGQRLWGHKEKSDEQGHLEVVVPADLKLSEAAQLQVLAVHRDKLERVDTRLAIEPVGYATKLSLDKPHYRPGETVYYRSLTLSRFGLAAERQFPIHFEMLDPGGVVVPDSQSEGVSDRGVGNGALRLPDALEGGQYTLVARSLDHSFPDQMRAFLVRSERPPRFTKQIEFTRDSYTAGDKVTAHFRVERVEGGAAAGAPLRFTATVDGENVCEKTIQADGAGAAHVDFSLPKKIRHGDGQLAVEVDHGGMRESIAKTLPINLGKVEVTFYPEGGDLAADLENRVYFTARNPLGKPVALKGTVVDGGGATVATIETACEGMGSFIFTPLSGEQYRLKITSPAVGGDEPRLPKVSTEQKIVLSTGSGVFDASQPLECTVRAAKNNLPLVVAAVCRGVQVGQQMWITSTKKGGAKALTIPLGDQVGGVIRLTAYDYSESPPKPLAERLVYRRMPRRLNVRVAGRQQRYSPGEKVGVALAVTNEKDEPVPAVLGVTVVDDRLWNQADDRTPSMTARLLLGGEMERPEDLEKADFYLSDGEKAPEALDLLLGTRGWRRFVERTLRETRQEQRESGQPARLAAIGGAAGPPAMFDNLEQIRNNYDQSLANYRAHRTRLLNMLTTVSFFGGLGLVLLVAMLGLLKIVSGVHLWVPAVGATACCLIIGAVLMDPNRLRPGQDAAIAFAPYLAAPAAVQEPPRQEKAAAGIGAALRNGEARKQDTEGRQESPGAPPTAAAPALARGASPPGAGKGEAAKADGATARRAADGKQSDKPLAPLAERARTLRFKAADKPDAELASALEDYRFPVRQYAHAHKPSGPGARKDRAETLFWQPLLVAGADGRAEIHFDLSDSVTTFRVLVDAHADGRIGSGRGEIVSRIPFSLTPTVPAQVTSGDRIDLPLVVENDSPDKLPVELLLEHGEMVKLDGQARRKLELPAAGRRREYFALDVVGEEGDCRLTLRGTSGRLADAVSRPLRVVPPGFPRNLSHSGRIDGQQEVVVDLPEHWVPGSLEVTLCVFPSAPAELQMGLESLLREPGGCFEQAGTSIYPGAPWLQYVREHNVSALGLAPFCDMAQVCDVDAAVVRQTADRLVKRRDGKGGFQPDARAAAAGVFPQPLADAYAVWALSESGRQGIEAEVKRVAQQAGASADPRLIALAAAAAVNAGKSDEAKRLLEKLAEAQAGDGSLQGNQGSTMRSGGLSLKVETTALGALAWLKMPAFAAQADRAIDWILKNRQGSGGFGSAQATGLALKALLLHAKGGRKAAAEGKLIVKRDGQLVAQRAVAAGQQEKIAVEGLAASLHPGENKLALSLTGGNQMPYVLGVSYRDRKPADDEHCPVRLTTRLAKSQVKAGETVALSAEVTNAADEGQPMTIVVLGLPAGLEPRSGQLEELKKSGAIDCCETRAREVICCWRELAPRKKIAVDLELVASVPGRYTGPPSQTYLLHTAEQKRWSEPLEVEITRD